MYRDESESAKSKLYNNQWAQYFNRDFPNMIYVIYNNQPGYHFNSDFCRLWRHPKRDQSSNFGGRKAGTKIRMDIGKCMNSILYYHV